MSLRNLLIAILVIALSGCAQKVYVNPNVSNEQSQRDFAACQLYAETGIPPATTTPPPNTGNKSYDTNCNVWGTTANCTTALWMKHVLTYLITSSGSIIPGCDVELLPKTKSCPPF